jgi:hypothetical protein
MQSSKLVREFWILIIFISALNALVAYEDINWKWQNVDNLLHFLGGAWVALGAIWLYFLSGFFKETVSFIKFIATYILSVTAVSVAWEIFELLYGVTSVGDPVYYFDTRMDFVMDLLGGLAACLYAYFIVHSLGNELPAKKGEVPLNLPT